MIRYVEGSATEPSRQGNKIVAHVCNDVGRWGRGFVVSVSQKWPKAEASYRQWFKERSDDWPPAELGSVVFVPVEKESLPATCCMNVGEPGKAKSCDAKATKWYRHNSDVCSFCDDHPHVCGTPVTEADVGQTWVANMIAQHDVVTLNGTPPIRYDALRNCLSELRGMAVDCRASIHMPRIGCGLAGGEWSRVEQLIEQELHDIDVTVYDFPESKAAAPGARVAWRR